MQTPIGATIEAYHEALNGNCDVTTSVLFDHARLPVALRLGETFGLDRCSIFLAERGGQSVRLVASYEDPAIRNYADALYFTVTALTTTGLRESDITWRPA